MSCLEELNSLFWPKSYTLVTQIRLTVEKYTKINYQSQHLGNYNTIHMMFQEHQI